MYKGRATGLSDGVHHCHGPVIMNGSDGNVAPTPNDSTEYEDIPNIGIGMSFCCEGQISRAQEIISSVTDFTRKFAKHFADLGAAKRDVKFTYAENFWRIALLSLEEPSGLPGAVW